jgi:outer membrane protein assembly factor BamB
MNSSKKNPEKSNKPGGEKEFNRQPTTSAVSPHILTARIALVFIVLIASVLTPMDNRERSQAMNDTTEPTPPPTPMDNAGDPEGGETQVQDEGDTTQNNQVDNSAVANLYLPFVNYSDRRTTDADADGWPMPGANLARTSWTPEEVPGKLKPVWFKHFKPYLSQKVHIVASYGLLFISTSEGLYAIDAETGNEVWIYRTELPLGHSPAISKGIAYVGGFDRKIHAIDAMTGQGLWTFTAGAGFSTNPLVVNGMLYAGNRDGYFYALHTEGPHTGQLAWKVQTGGPILYSAAYHKDIVYFASNDNHAYALNAITGDLVWKSDKLPGRGFHSYWPVIYRDHVIFSGSYIYRHTDPFSGAHNKLDPVEIYPAGSSRGDPIGKTGNEPGDWIKGTPTIDMSAVVKYLQKYPHRRTSFFLNLSDGKEYTFNHDGKPAYAPILWFGSENGTRYPPAVGPDGVIYQANHLHYDTWIPRGRVSGWKFGTPFVSSPSGSDTAIDEPIAYAIGGNIVYWKRCCDRMAGSLEVAREGGSYSDLTKWTYYDEGGNRLRRTLPELFDQGWDFAYWKHGDQTPPIPYRGKVYNIVNNAVVAFGPNGRDPVLSSNMDVGKTTGEKPGDIERSQVIPGLNTNVTLNNNSWPLLIQQETYFETDERPETRGRWFRLFEIAGSTSSNPSSLNISDKGLSTLLTSTFDGGKTLKTWVSKRSPTTLAHTDSSVYQLRGNFVGIAYPTSSGVKVRTGSATINGSELSAGWILVWDGVENHRWSPVIASLQRRSSQIELSGSQVRISYSGEAGYLSITPLYGLSHPNPGEVNTWPNGIPQSTVDRIHVLDRVARAFPESGSENWAINNSTLDAQLTYSYQFIDISNEFGIAPLRLAILPPRTALAAWNGSPIRVNGAPLENHLDLNYVTPLGKVAGVPNASSVTVDLPGIARYWRGQTPSLGGGSSHPVQDVLIHEIRKIVQAGPLLPGYGMVGMFDNKSNHRIGDWLVDYWSNPAETVYTLIQALPFLPGDLQNEVRNYLRNEVQAYPLHRTAHIGWNGGANRHWFDIPPEVLKEGAEFTPTDKTGFNKWGLQPFNLYAMWLFAQEFGDSQKAFNDAKSQLDTKPKFLGSTPYVLNSYIAGYIGYLKLAGLAGAGAQPEAEKTLIDLLVMRAALTKYHEALRIVGFEYGGYQWSVRKIPSGVDDLLFNPAVNGSLWSQLPLYGWKIDTLYGLSGASTGGGYAFGIDFINLTPELAAFMRDYSSAESQAIISNYATRAPYWFVSQAEEAAGEGVFHTLYDVIAMFQARAHILNENRSSLDKFLDVPATRVGDLYYIQTLVAYLQAKD